jgi:WD40 repeat protein
MKRLYTPENEISKYYFVSDLIKFFQAIDINGDGHLEWSEFTEYIIENIRRIEKPNYKNKAFQENEVISSAYSKISNEYRITQVIDPGTLNCVKKIVYLPRDQRYYLLETGSNLIRIYSSDFALLDYLQLNSDSQSSFIVDFSFDRENMVFGAIFEGSARFCNFKLLGNVKTSNECEPKKLAHYHKIEYLPLHKCWAFLSKNGELRLSYANYRSRTMLDYNPILVLKQHESLITDIVELEEPQYVATASMDGNVKFYSVYLKKNVTLEHIGEQTNSAINGKQKKGVLGIDYTREFGSYFLSWGFSSSVFVYALEVSLLKGFSGKYKEHSGNLLAARFLKSFPYVLSFDDKLSMRIWDFRRFQTVQVINC